MAGEFVQRNRVALAVGAGVGLGVGLGASLAAFSLSRKLRPPDSAAELSRELSAMREEVAALRADVRDLSSSIAGGSHASGPHHLTPQKEQRVQAFVSETLSEVASSKRASDKDPELYSASSSDSDDGNFYDAEDDVSQEEGGGSLREVYRQAEEWQRDPSPDKKRQAYELFRSTPGAVDDHEFLWRMSRATFFYAETMPRDSKERKELVFEAKAYAFGALDVEERDADVQKMCALTLGLTKDYLSISDSILMGHQYKKHIEAALALRPGDPVLHHLAGRWCWAVAELSWLERKAAAALFAAPPTSSHSEALKEFLLAERGSEAWLVNKLYVAKAYLRLDEPEAAAPFLRDALRLSPQGQDDRDALVEAQALVSKHRF